MQKELIVNDMPKRYELKTVNYHVPVLLQEIIEGLEPKRGETVLDCTLNQGGHGRVLAEYLGSGGTLVGIDRDHGALERAKDNLSGLECSVILEEANFRNLDVVLGKHDISSVDKILFDFGISSEQLDLSGRGFSFTRDEPLLMTMSVVPKMGELTALEIVNSWNEEDLSSIINEYGEERFYGRIARAIIAARKKGVIHTTAELSEIISRAVPSFYRKGRLHPATRTFQALRIAVNDELEAIREGLNKGLSVLKKGGRLAAISFHSLEDRIVKETFRRKDKNEFRIINKKPIVPGREEVINNPRSRSAKLRVIEKIK